MTGKVLVVDDKPRILEALERQLGRQFELQTATSPEKGLKTVTDDGPFAVVVSDLRMPVMNGIELLRRVRQISPDTVRIMLTGDADLSSAVMAVNEDNIFQFLIKPCPSNMLVRTLDIPLTLLAEDAGYKATYDGGSIPDTKAGSGMKVYIEAKQIRLNKDKQEFVTIPASAVTEISYGQDVHRRVGTAVAVGIFTLGVGALTALSKPKSITLG